MVVAPTCVALIDMIRIHVRDSLHVRAYKYLRYVDIFVISNYSKLTWFWFWGME